MRIPNLFDGAKIEALSWAAKKNRQTTRKNRQTAKEVASKGAKSEEDTRWRPCHGHVARGCFGLLRNTYNLTYYHDTHGN